MAQQAKTQEPHAEHHRTATTHWSRSTRWSSASPTRPPRPTGCRRRRRRRSGLLRGPRSRRGMGALRPDRGVAFEAFAIPRIKGAVIDAIRAADWVPRKARQRARLTGEPVAMLVSMDSERSTDDGDHSTRRPHRRHQRRRAGRRSARRGEPPRAHGRAEPSARPRADDHLAALLRARRAPGHRQVLRRHRVARLPAPHPGAADAARGDRGRARRHRRS